MFLKSLLIKNENQLIREIKFHNGLNLIIDETVGNQQSSGNNVGKTTVLKLIDFCLGSQGKNIYQDSESKQITQIRDFLTKNNIIICLTLDCEGKTIEIRRNFLTHSQKIQEINGKAYKNLENFNKELASLIFNTKIDKPSFRSIIGKNIRYEKSKLTNVIKIYEHFTDAQYESLMFFWLGIPLDDGAKKQSLITEIKTEKSLLKNLQNKTSRNKVEQSLIVIERDIDELEKSKGSFNVNDSYKSDLFELNNIKADINAFSTELNKITYRKTLMLESKDMLEKERATIDVDNIKDLYNSAKQFIPNLQQTFEDLLCFHNSMLDKKIEYMIIELPDLEAKIFDLKTKLAFLLEKEKILTRRLQKLDTFKELETIIIQLNQKYEQKGMYEEQLSQFEDINNRISNLQEQLNIINTNINNRKIVLNERITEFNKFFTKISEQLYNERFILSERESEQVFTFEVNGLDNNLGTGKKKGQIAAFDFAYVQFCDLNKIRCLHFILHDQLESMHNNQLETIASIANNTNSQYIVSIIRDKLPPAIKIDNYAILSLSQTDKLFKIS